MMFNRFYNMEMKNTSASAPSERWLFLRTYRLHFSYCQYCYDRYYGRHYYGVHYYLRPDY